MILAKTRMLVACLAVGLVAAQARATILQADATDNTSEVSYSVSSSDLINASQPPLASASHPRQNPVVVSTVASNPAALNNGSIGISYSANGYAALNSVAANLDGASTSTYNLNTVLSPAGYM